MKTLSTKLTFYSLREKINVLTVVLFLASQIGIAQCYVAIETNPSFVANAGCADGTLRLGAGANFTIPVSPNTNYIFNWTNGGNSNGYCATPNAGAAFSNQTTWNSGAATSLNISSSRITAAGWIGTSGIMTYRNATPSNATSTASVSSICIGSSVSISGGGGTNGTLYYQGTTPNGTNTSTTANPQVFNPGAAGTFTYYWRANNNNCWGAEAGATVTVSPITVAGTAAVAGPTACINTTMAIGLSGQTGTVVNWEWNFNGGAFTSIGGAGLNNITSPSLTQVGTYQFRANVQSGPCASMYSNTTTVNVFPSSVGGTASVAVGTFCSGGNTSISLSGQTGAILSWERNANGLGWVDIGNSGLATIPTGILTAGTYEYRAIVQSSPCASVTSSIALVSVDAPSVGGNTTASGTLICSGDNPTVSLTGNTGAVIYWERQINGGGFNNIGNAGSVSISTGVLTTGVYDYRAVVQSGTCLPSTSASVSITVSSPSLGGSAVPQVATICQGGSTNINLSGYNGAIINWELQENGGGYNNIGNAGLNVIASGALNTAGNNEFRAVIQNGGCPAVQSTPASISVNPTSVGGTVSANVTTLCAGGTADLTLSGQTGNILGWERQYNGGGWTNIGNAGINPLTTAALNAAGTYEYRAIVQSGICPSMNSASTSITVDPFDIATFNYSSSVFCQGGVNPSPSVVQGGGTFTATPVGLVVDAATGIIDLNLSAAGSYSITYTTSSACPASANQSITIVGGGNASFSYGSLNYCLDGSNALPTAVTAGGTFTSSPAGIIFANASTGEIDFTNSVDGSYYVTYTLPGACPSSQMQTVNLIDPGNSAFAYSTNAYCVGGPSNPSPSIAQFGGTFSASPLGLVFTNTQTGTIDLTASVANTYTVTYNSGGPCPSTTTQTITLNAAGDPLFFYSASTFCQDAANPTPFVSAPGGSFTSSPAGLLFTSPVSGEISLGTSLPGGYVVTYNTGGTCPSTYSNNVLVVANQNAAFNYSQASYCQNDVDPTPNVSQVGGTFTASPAGLVFDNPFTGRIDVSASSAGTYTVTYTVPGTCIGVYTRQVVINAGATATLSYPSSSFCSNGTNPIPTVSPAGGTFTASPGGIVFVSGTTGEINLATSQAGTYTITYASSGACASSQTQTVAISPAGNSAFAYSSNAYCVGGPSNPSPSIAQFGGTFSASPLGLVFTNTQTGTIDLTASVANTYTVTYNSGGPCPSTTTQTITLNAAGDPLFFYSASTFCQDAANPTPFVSAPGGSFTSSPAGLLFTSPVSGEISLGTSLPGGYVVTYNTGGTCPSTYSNNVLVVANQNAAFNYSQASYCQNDVDPTPNVSQVGGTFTASPAGLVFDNPFTGRIDVSASSAGTYTVTYTVPGTCIGVYTRQVVINAGATATLSYTSSSFCSNGTDPVATVSPAGGVFTSSPLGLSVDGSGTIDLSASVPGAYAVSYAASGACATAATANVIIITSPQAFIQPISPLCTGSSSIILTASPSGGTWSGGAYISPTGTFDPSVSGSGSFPVNYVVTGSGGCNASATYNVVVNTSATVSITPAGPFCSNDSIQVLTASPLGGTWSGNPFVSINGLFFPAEAGPGVFPVMYTVNNGGCSSSIVASIQVLNSPNPLINQVASICASGSPIGLTSNISGGTWSGGSYITASGTFDPALAAVGNNLVTYTVTNGSCTAQSTAQIAVNGNPNVSIITPSPFCQGNPSAFLIVNLPGGVFTGGSYINGSGLFDPSLAAIGNNVVIYTMTSSNGCVGSDTVNVVVNANPDATITYPGIVCQDNAPFSLTAATAGGIWSGGAYVNSGIFDPSVAGPGVHTVTYNVTTGGCSATSTISVTVDPNPVAAFIYQPNALFATFTDLAQNADTWSWNFGDGSAEVTTQNPTHQFPDNGIYQVRLIVTNDCGSDTLVLPVLVNKNVGIEENVASASLNIFPNPADQYLQLTASGLEEGEWKLNVLDVSGKTVMQETMYPSAGILNKTIDVYVLKPGVYFINLQNGTNTQTVKFVKM
jgi:hypothetical protein